MRREATDDEIAAMQDLLRAGFEAGAIGFSSSWARTHNDAEGNMVPSRCATHDEIVAQVRKTVIHEVAHHFGIGEERLRELGWG